MLNPADLPGKRVIVGYTLVGPDNAVIDQYQSHGTITRITHDALYYQTPDGEELSLPPDLSALEPAAPGNYRLRSTGEVISNPDFTISYTIHQPPPGDSPT